MVTLRDPVDATVCFLYASCSFFRFFSIFGLFLAGNLLFSNPTLFTPMVATRNASEVSA